MNPDREAIGHTLSIGDWDYWALAIEAALMGVAADNVKRWVYKGEDGKWCVR